ncbi:MAG: hypothetical protein HRT72_07910 [Flavobacteriales bacterium]|nr:hypothetical protein [Flavobacteriales bacterium]
MNKFKSILVIEKNEVMRNVAKLTMQRMGVSENVKYLIDGFEAIDYLLTILEQDVMIPDMIYLEEEQIVSGEVNFTELISDLCISYSGKKPRFGSLNKLLLKKNRKRIEKNRIANSNTVWSKGNKWSDFI